MKTTSVFYRNMDAFGQGKRYIVNKGSTRSSKTYSLLQLLFQVADNSPRRLVISIVSESMPHLKRGCIRDFMNILQGEGRWEPRQWNATEKTYRLGESLIEFFSADNASKVHGPSRDILYINECINIPYETYRQLAIRTTGTIFLDCNPAFSFWLDDKVLTSSQSILIHSTYRDNEFLSEAQINEIESNQSDANWWRVYGEGLTGTLSGAVIDNWDIVDSLPKTYKDRWIGIDFGFTNDPTAIVDIRLSKGELWIDELLFAKSYDNLMIARHLDESGIGRNVPIIADSAEPKSIREIASQGWRIEAAQKGVDSILTGIGILNRYTKHVTARSLNIINEYRNYRWQTDQDGNALNRPIDRYNHSIDAQRYVCLNKLLERGNNSLSYGVIQGRRGV